MSFELPMEAMDDMPDLEDLGGSSKMPSLIEQNEKKEEEEWQIPKSKKKKLAREARLKSGVSSRVRFGVASVKGAEPEEKVDEKDAMEEVEVEVLRPCDDVLKKACQPEVEDMDEDDEEGKEIQRKQQEDPTEFRHIFVPRGRFVPLKENWVQIFTPVVKQLGIQIRFNPTKKRVELRNPPGVVDTANLSKATDFVRAFTYGFEVNDALALIRLDHLFLESFEILDVRQTLQGDNTARAIGRMMGKDGRVKFVIENVTKTRIARQGEKIHILGAFQNIKIARRALSLLVCGASPSKIYGNLRNFANRALERV